VKNYTPTHLRVYIALRAFFHLGCSSGLLQ